MEAKIAEVEDAIVALNDLKGRSDTQQAMSDAVGVLLTLLIELGHHRVVVAFEAIHNRLRDRGSV